LWLDGALWLKWYGVNFFVSFAIAALIHVMFVVAIAWVGAARTWRALHRKHKATAAPAAGIRRAGACIDSTPGARHGDMERDARRCRPFNRS